MKFIPITLTILLLGSFSLCAQTDATNFTATDCNGTSHDLFSELNSGKVVVLTWVMPCASCINDARGAFEAAQSFSSSHPGRVVYYLIDDFGNQSCNTLLGWANTNGIKSNVTIFRNEGVVINEDDYGGTGMPHVAVIGPDRKIYFNVRNGSNNQSAIKTAIATALTQTSVDESGEGSSSVIFPNPANDQLTICFNVKNCLQPRVEIFNMLGEKLPEGEQTQSMNGRFIVNTSSYETGMYVLKLSAGTNSTMQNFIIAR